MRFYKNEKMNDLLKCYAHKNLIFKEMKTSNNYLIIY